MAGCCWYFCRPPKFLEKEPLIFDINKVLTDKAWAVFRTCSGSLRRKFLRRRDFVIDIEENFFEFDAIGEPEFDQVDVAGGDGADIAEGAPRGGLEDVAMDTTFYNDTAEKQTCHFKFSKTLTTKVNVSYQQGFMVGGKANLSLGLPKAVAKLAIGVSAETKYEVRESKGQSFEESIQMEATNDIVVGPMSKYIAKMHLNLKTFHAKFRVRMRMSMPQKRSSVCIRRKSDKEVVFVFYVTNLEDIFFPYGGKKGLFPYVEQVREGDDTAQDKVDILVEGIIKGSLMCDHVINVSSDESEEKKMSAKNRSDQDQPN